MRSAVRSRLVALAIVAGYTSTAHAQSRPPEYTRAALEVLGVLGLSAGWYWIDIDRNLADWDRLSIEQRFRLDAIRLDNNNFAINQIAHPMAGGGYYSLARANGLSIAVSSAYTLAASLAWEYGLEFQERTSYNDFIVTPGAGIALGEAVHSLGIYLTSGCGSSGVAETLSWVLGFAAATHQAVDGELSDCHTARDALGLSAATAHRLDIAYSLSSRNSSAQRGTGHSLHLNSELIELAVYGGSPSLQGSFSNGEWTRLALSIHGGTGSEGVSFAVHSVLAGFYQQQSTASTSVSAIAGIGLGFSYDVREQLGWRERLSEMHLPGAYYQSKLDWHGLRLQLSGRVSPDFTATNSLAFRADDTTASTPRGKSVLRKQAYFFGYGWSSEVAASLSYGPIRVGAQFEFGEVDSIEGEDRVQELLEVDEEGTEVRAASQAHFRLKIPGNGVIEPYVQLQWKQLQRRGELDGVRRQQRVDELGLHLGAQL